jgi:hypothetical protein
MRKKQILWEYDKSVQWKIFEPKREEATEGWRKLHNEEFHNLYFTP